jgi:hypothetical protein
VNKGQSVPHSEALDNREVLAVHHLNIAFQEERQFIPQYRIYRFRSIVARRWRLSVSPARVNRSPRWR